MGRLVACPPTAYAQRFKLARLTQGHIERRYGVAAVDAIPASAHDRLIVHREGDGVQILDFVRRSDRRVFHGSAAERAG